MIRPNTPRAYGEILFDTYILNISLIICSMKELDIISSELKRNIFNLVKIYHL